MKKIALIFSMIALPLGFFSLTSAKNAQAVTNIQNPIVLELFTSQSCSSCPPADKILGDLATQNDNIIALSCNVTYWNHLHWQDTLSKDFCTDRQRQYVSSLQSRGPYTPQIVINGRHEMVGSRGAQINRTIAGEQNNTPIKPITLHLNGQNLSIKLPEIAGNDSFALLLIAHGAAHTQDIPSGENRGQRVDYTNPVQDIISLGTWDGTAKTMQYDVSALKDADGYVVLAQKNGVTGEIAAAAKIKN